jgi:hypothetical protein
MEWQHDARFGQHAESACGPRCGGIWGVRSRRVPQHEPTQSSPIEDIEGGVSPVTYVPHPAPIENERRPTAGR